MTFSLAISKSLDSLLPVAGFEGENGRKSAASQGGDGFGELLNRLASITPSALAEADAEETETVERQGGDLPTGNSLPLADPGLPLLLPEIAAGEEAVTVETGTIPHAAPPIASPLLAFEARSGLVSGSPVTADAKPVRDLPKGAEGPTLSEAAGDIAGKGLEVRIAAAKEPAAAKASTMTAVAESGKVRLDLPMAGPAAATPGTLQAEARGIAQSGMLAAPINAPRQARTAIDLRKELPAIRSASAPMPSLVDGEPAATGKFVPGEADVSGKAERLSAAQAAPTPSDGEAHNGKEAARLERGAETASAGERKAKFTGIGSDNAETVQRIVSPVDVAKGSLHAAARIDEGASAASPVTTVARPVGQDQHAQVERIVDQIMAARHADFSKAATIAVTHKEFGAMTVTFDTAGDGMNVRIAAEDGEAHRALAAAMANDRGPVRQPDMATAPATTAQAAQAGTERGVGSGHPGSGSGHGPAAGEQRQQHGEQRGRDRAQSAPSSQQSKPSSDDALYV